MHLVSKCLSVKEVGEAEVTFRPGVENSLPAQLLLPSAGPYIALQHGCLSAMKDGGRKIENIINLRTLTVPKTRKMSQTQITFMTYSEYSYN